MLEIRPSCEHCDRELPYDSLEAMICTFECTFCEKYVKNVLQEVCPNCGGSFEKRPIRPQELLKKYPPSKKRIHKPVNIENHLERIKNKEKL